VGWRGRPAVPGPADADRPWVDRARRGEADAFGELVRTHQHRLVNFVRALTASQADAEDVAQEAFLRAYRAIGQFRGTSSFRTWLYQIATNVARTHALRRRSSPEDAAGDPETAPQAFGHPTAEGDVESSVVARDRIDRALAALSAELREAVVLRDVEGLDYKEIAEALAIPIGTVESRIFRARQQLRGLLGPR
jgi:RNA polymerase sigma-70 factor (ECF subfamily)